MPLRRWFAGHGLPSWYSWVVVVLLSITTSGLALIISINTIHRNQEAQRRQAEQGRELTCSLVIAQDDAFTDPAPVTAAGKKAAAAWHRLRVQLGCG